MFLGHNVATLTRPNCFGWYFFRLKRFSKIHLAVFPQAKWFSGQNFRVKNEIQNSIPEFASRYGMSAGDHCGDLADMMPAPAPARRHRPATGHGHRLPATASHGTGHPDRPPATHGTAARTGTGTAKHRPAWRRGKAPDGLRPILNKKAGNP